mgnify:CR=1 FL=1
MARIVVLASKTKWDPDFAPCYTPEEMLKQGVFEGKYINNIRGIPKEWKKLPKVVGPKDEPNVALNKFGVKSRQPLSVWKANGWIMTDANGWFEWYCKYYNGRRLGEEDRKQIKRWRSFVARHQGQIVKSGKLKDKNSRAKQRQGLLQWGWDSTKEFNEDQLKRNRRKLSRLGFNLEG